MFLAICSDLDTFIPDASDSERIARDKLGLPGASLVAVVCFVPAVSLRHGRRLASLLHLPMHRLGGFSTVSIPCLEAAALGVEAETERPPIATMIFCEEKGRKSFGLKRRKKTLSAATKPAGS